MTPVATPHRASEAVRTFDQLSRDDVAFAGGKGANLGELTARRHAGPARLRRRRAGVRRVLRPRPGCASDRAARSTASTSRTPARSRRRRRAAAAQMRRRRADARRWLSSAIRAAYAELRGDDERRPVAVRSSATAEDTAVGVVRRHERDLPQRARRRRRARRGPALLGIAVRRAHDLLPRPSAASAQADMDIAVVVQRQIASAARRRDVHDRPGLAAHATGS